VGQDLWEEISIVERGKNLGWNVREAAHCFFPKDGCSSAGLVDPIFDYDRSLGLSVTGGFVYTGKRIPTLAGRYVFGDFGTGRLWALDLPDAPKRVRHGSSAGSRTRSRPSAATRTANSTPPTSGRAASTG
jgi:hypothetical protein